MFLLISLCLCSKRFNSVGKYTSVEDLNDPFNHKVPRYGTVNYFSESPNGSLESAIFRSEGTSLLADDTRTAIIASGLSGSDTVAEYSPAAAVNAAIMENNSLLRSNSSLGADIPAGYAPATRLNAVNVKSNPALLPNPSPSGSGNSRSPAEGQAGRINNPNPRVVNISKGCLPNPGSIQNLSNNTSHLKAFTAGRESPRMLVDALLRKREKEMVESPFNLGSSKFQGVNNGLVLGMGGFSANGNPDQTMDHILTSLGNVHVGGLARIMNQSFESQDFIGTGFYDPRLLKYETYKPNAQGYSERDFDSGGQKSLLGNEDSNVDNDIECFKPSNGFGHPYCTNEKVVGVHFDLSNWRGPYRVNAHLESPLHVKKPERSQSHHLFKNKTKTNKKHRENANGLVRRFVTPEDEFHYM